jgi:EAL domain-containing protein (putative c-di-GMP-specific phosphodiesterase class I)
LPTPSTKAAQSADAGAQATSAESLGWQLRAALPPLRLQSVSIYNLEGDVLWLSEGALGPDEHAFVVEAIEALREPSAPPHRECDLQDNGGAVFLAVRSPRGDLVGLVMILVDAKALQGLGARIVTPHVRTILQSMAILLRPPGLTTVSQRLPTLESAASASPAPAPAPPPSAAPVRSNPVAKPVAKNEGSGTRSADRRAASTPAASSPATPRPAPSVERRGSAASDRRAVPRAPISTATPTSVPRPSTVAARPPSPEPDTVSGGFLLEVLEPRLTDDVLTFELTDNVPVLAAADKAADSGERPSVPEPSSRPASTSSEVTARPATGAAVDGPLRVQELVKLRAGGRTRRLQVVPRGAEGREQAFDALALTEIIGWLRAHPEAHERTPMSFALAVPAHALEEDRLPALIASSLRQGGIPADCIGFELQEDACVRHRAQAERFIAQCEKLGCFIVLDDFKFHSGAVELLRSKALRLVKVDAKLGVDAMRDKLSQARVIAIAQAAKVLGIHCSAKQVDSQAARRWLTAIGFDFAESTLFDGPRSLQSLLALPAAE